MNYVYILYSNTVNSYYIGTTINVEKRLNAHNSKKYERGYTKKADDWEIYVTIQCTSKNQALKNRETYQKDEK